MDGDGSPFFTTQSRRTYHSNTEIVMGEWIHVTLIVIAGNNMKVYINCRENGGIYEGNGGNLQYSSTPGVLGKHDRVLGSPANHFKGSIDEFMYWDRVLTEEEIEILCQSTASTTDYESPLSQILIYPNPAKEIVHLNPGDRDIDKIIIHNSLGKKILASKFTENLDVSSLVPGFYFISFQGDDFLVTKALIKE